MSKPILDINNPKAITPGGAYFLMGLEPQTVGNRVQLRQNWQVDCKLSSGTTGWSSLPVIRDICNRKEKEAGNNIFYAIGNKYITRHLASSVGSTSYGTLVDTITDAGFYHYCAYPSIINTEAGNMLFTSETGLGKIFCGYHTGGTQTNKIIDKAGRDLSAYEGMEVRNVKDNSVATITSVTSTNATNDTLNFTGVFPDSGSINNDDEWAIFIDSFKNLDTAVPYPQFGGQLEYRFWSRQIINFYGEYFIGNGNYLAKLSNDETTYDEDYTKLPLFMQFNCADVVGNYIYIGGDVQGSGKLVVWDGVTPNNYVSIIQTSAPITAIKAYRGGALFLSGSAIYWTDGFTVKSLSNMPGTDGDLKLEAGHSSMLIDGKYAYINAGVGGLYNYNESKRGLWVYDIINNSWTYNPYENISGKKLMYDTVNGGVFSATGTSSNDILVSYADDNYNYFSQLMTHGVNNFSMAIFSYNAPKNTMINYAELILGQTMNTIYSTAPNASVTVALSDGKKPFWMYAISGAAAEKNQIPVNGTMTGHSNATVGDLVMILTGNSAGDYAFISSITGEGTADEVWTLDRDLTDNLASADRVQVINCRKAGEHTVTDYFEQPLMFPDGLLVSGDFYVIILIKNTSGVIDIRDIALY